MTLQLPGNFRDGANNGQVYTSRVAHLPGVRFEFHPQVKIIYYIREGVQPEIGEPIAQNVDGVELARLFTLMFARGYVEGNRQRLNGRAV